MQSLQTNNTDRNNIDPESTLEVRGEISAEFSQILTPEALTLVQKLVTKFNPKRKELLRRRIERQEQIRRGARFDFLAETREIRESEWTVAPIPADLHDRRVEITGPVDRKMIINALNSGASVFMADFEDSNAPTWDNVIRGQINLRDAVRRDISFEAPNGKHYQLKDKTAVLMVRPRGWHLLEKHITLDGEAIPASLLDFGLYFFHNASTLIERGTGPYFYLPKLESHLEARLWNDVFVFAQKELAIPNGSIRATVLLETLPAAFEMNEILYELRDHSAGLNCGRWDYIFSIIKKFQGNEDFSMPDRGLISMTTRPLLSYSLLAIQTCHRRGIHAIGGMAAQIPIKNDPEANEKALEKVRQDKEREARDGHDGTWVAHPGLVGIAMDYFNKYMPSPNQIDKKREDVKVAAEDLQSVPEGSVTEQGLLHNIDVGIQYMAAWLSGNGCVPIYNLMEDAATAEISRSQLWQWLHHGNARLDDGREITAELYEQLFGQVLDRLREELGDRSFREGNFALAGELIKGIAKKSEFTEFMTTVGYEYLD